MGVRSQEDKAFQVFLSYIARLRYPGLHRILSGNKTDLENRVWLLGMIRKEWLIVRYHVRPRILKLSLSIRIPRWNLLESS